MSLRDEILKAAGVPRGTSTIAGQQVHIRGLTTAEELAFLKDGVGGTAPIDVCAACLLDDKGKPLFRRADVESLAAGTLKQAYMDILALTFPAADLEKNS